MTFCEMTFCEMTFCEMAIDGGAYAPLFSAMRCASSAV
jgi:hypothetical protein